MSDPDIAAVAPPREEPGESPVYPLSAQLVQETRMMAALMMSGVLATPVQLSFEEAAAFAVRLAMGIANEVTRYGLKDGKAVRIAEEPNAP